jgi:hypothetical protein
MVAGGAAMLISAGAAFAGQGRSAVEQSLRGMTAARQDTSRDAKGGDPAMNCAINNTVDCLPGP